MTVAHINTPPAVQKAAMGLVGPQSTEEDREDDAETVIDILHTLVEQTARKLFHFALTNVKGEKTSGTEIYENGQSEDYAGQQVRHHYQVTYPSRVTARSRVKGASTDKMARDLVKEITRHKIRPQASSVKGFFENKAVVSYMEKLFKHRLDGLVEEASRRWEYVLPPMLLEQVEEVAYREVDVDATTTTYDEEADEDGEESLSTAVDLRVSLQKLALDASALSGGKFTLKLDFAFGVKVQNVYLPWDREYSNFSPF